MKFAALRRLLCCVASFSFFGFFIGCGDSSAHADAAPAKPEPGYVTGHVLGGDGKPIDAPDAAIDFAIYGVSEAGEKVHYNPAVKPDGSYKQKVVPGSYEFGILSKISVKFDGKPVTLPLEPVGKNWNKDQDAADGIVQDFVWKTQGQMPGTDGNVNNHTNWYGATIGLTYPSYREDKKQATPPLPDGAKLTFNLKPTGKRVDGKDAEALTIERVVKTKEITPIDALNDLPIADYDLSGSVVMPDGTTRPLGFQFEYAKYGPSMKVKFQVGNLGNFTPMHVTFVVD